MSRSNVTPINPLQQCVQCREVFLPCDLNSGGYCDDCHAKHPVIVLRERVYKLIEECDFTEALVVAEELVSQLRMYEMIPTLAPKFEAQLLPGLRDAAAAQRQRRIDLEEAEAIFRRYDVG